MNIEDQIDSVPRPPQFNWKNARIVGYVMGALIGAAGIYTISQPSTVPVKATQTGTTSILVRTTPSGASIRINNEIKCVSDCSLTLTEGEHQIQAFLAGFEPRASTVNLSAGVPLAIDLVMEPQSLSIRILSDLPTGRVLLDGKAVGLLQDGQLGLDRVSPGRHKLKLVSAKGTSEFEFDSSPGNTPQLVAPIKAADLFALVVGHASGKAELYTNEHPLKIQMEDSVMGEVGPLGLELHNLQPGDRTFLVGEGKRQKTFLVPLNAQPSLLIFARFDPNSGSLVVKSNEDGATVYLNNYEYWRKTKDGELRIANLPVGPLTVRVAKWLFDAEPFSVKTAIRKGEELALDFTFKPALARAAIPRPQPIPEPADMPAELTPAATDPFLALWEDQTNWESRDGWYTKTGGNFVFLRKAPVNGTIRFSLTPVKGLKAQWIANFHNSRNFVLYSIDSTSFTRKEFVDGKPSEVRLQHELSQKDTFTIQVSIGHAVIKHELFDGKGWRNIDNLTATDRDLSSGRFALYLQGTDAVGVANFAFAP